MHDRYNLKRNRFFIGMGFLARAVVSVMPDELEPLQFLDRKVCVFTRFSALCAQ